ncbi:hypothetical protein ACFP1I_04460 [Dyadobacter subterraneus]|uniref:POTRA domain-containing protein n=2 Tax=Dyadobacter subterraneus TaxID=2773304 RepID=A0ABR9WJU8_9BACT|nr:hypothetical protein [Dyadobacter subterraneus]
MFRYLLLFLFISTITLAQKSDSLRNGGVNMDSVRYTNLKIRMSKTKFSRSIYRLLFRDVYNQGKKGEVKAIETNPFTPYEGMVIRKIVIKQLDVLGESVYDTTRVGKQLERFLSKNFHTNTRERIIRKSFLRFSEGDEIQASVLRDNERLLRKNGTITDARIIVVPRTDVTWMADIVVIIQDSWSWNISASPSKFNKFSLGLNNTNVNGTTHQQLTKIRYDASDSLQKFQFRTIYTIPYIGKTFITGQANFIYERDQKIQSIVFSRSFLTTETKYAGSIEAGHAKLRNYKRDLDSLDKENRYQTGYYYYDAWLGRSFKFPFKNSSLSEKSRLVFAMRHNRYKYTQRPEVRADTNIIYWDRSATLISFGYSNRSYKRDVLIYGFGRTEDVPVGNLLAVTAGQENTEFGQRGYAGVQYATGHYLPHSSGYLYGLVNVGSYFKNDSKQPGVISGQVNYISKLIPFRYSYFRQFVTVRYTRGVNRDPVDYINISRDNGIRGINSDRLIGTKKFTVGLETVYFSEKSLLGFRIAYYAFADFGLVTQDKFHLWNAPVYQGYGFGLRLRNENLSINTLQLRFGYYPNIPGTSSAIRYAIEGNTPLRLRDFDIAAPSMVPYQ